MPEVFVIDRRLGRPVFDTYAPLIAQAIANWPSETTFRCPPDRALATFIARFRDTLCGYRLHHWETDHFSQHQFDAIDGKFALRPSEDGLSVIWGHRKTAGRPRTIGTRGTISGATTAFGPFIDLPREDLLAFLTLLNSNRIPGCQVRIVGPLPLDLDIDQYPNVGTVQSGNLTILI